MVAYSATYDVQETVRETILADSILNNRLTGVFDEASTNQEFPYITLGTKVQVPWNQFQNRGFEVTLVLDIWTSLEDGDSHFTILDDVHRLFNGPKLQLHSYTNIDCQVEWSTTLIDEAVSTRHTVARLRTFNQ